MKRSDVLLLIANQIDFINGTFCGFKKDFSKEDLGNADVILTTLEHAGMLPPLRDKMVDGKFVGYSNMQVPEWED